MDGYVIIGAEMDTSKIDKDLQKLYDKLEKEERREKQLLNKKAKLDIDISKYEDKMEKAKQKTNELAEELERIAKEQLQMDGIDITPENIERAKQYLQSLKFSEEMKAGEYQDYTFRAKPFQEISNQFDKYVTSIENGEKELEIMKQKYDDIDYQIQKCEQNQAKYNSEIQEALNKSEGMNFNFSGMGKTVNKLTNKFGAVLKKVSKIVLALLGMRTIINLITRSFNTLAQYNTELGSKMEQMRLVLAVGLEPIINYLVNALHVILSLINQIYNALFGIDLFGRASELWSKKMAENLGSGASSAKEMKKQLAGFDEMNVLTEPSNTSSGSGGGSNIQPWTLQPNLDLSVFDLDAILKWVSDTFDKIIGFINKKIEDFNPKEFASGISKVLVKLLDLINKTFTDLDWGNLVSKIIQTILHLDWASILGKLLENIIVTSFIFPIELLLGIIDGIVSTVLDFIEDPKQFENTGEKILNSLINGLNKTLPRLFELMKDIVIKTFKIFGINSEGAESVTFENIGELAMKGLKKGISMLIDQVVNQFTTMINSIKKKFEDFKKKIDDFVLSIYNFFASIEIKIINTISNAVNWIINKFNQVTNFFHSIGITIGDAFSGAIKNAVNSAFNWIESKVNTFIRAINSAINVINNLPGVKISRLSTISLPRLAVGGIINQPGRGVPVGGALAGEAGREGILPLTDKRAMEELGREIGKWITLNATIPVSVGNRQVAREFRRIMAEDSFTTNS